MKVFFKVLCIFPLIFCVSTASNAALVEYHVSGVVEKVYDNSYTFSDWTGYDVPGWDLQAHLDGRDAYLRGTVSTGDIVTGSVWFETNGLVDNNPDNENYAFYLPGPNSYMQFVAGGIAFSADGEKRMVVMNSYSDHLFLLGLFSTPTGPDDYGFMYFSIQDDTGIWLSDDSFPHSLPFEPNVGLQITNGDSRIFDDEGYRYGYEIFIDFNSISLVNSIPIPSAIWLLGTGLIGLVGFRRKFWKA